MKQMYTGKRGDSWHKKERRYYLYFKHFSIKNFHLTTYRSITPEKIGKTFNRNHATVLYAVKVVSDLCRRDTSVRRQVEILDRKMLEI